MYILYNYILYVIYTFLMLHITWNIRTLQLSQTLQFESYNLKSKTRWKYMIRWANSIWNIWKMKMHCTMHMYYCTTDRPSVTSPYYCESAAWPPRHLVSSASAGLWARVGPRLCHILGLVSSQWEIKTVFCWILALSQLLRGSWTF